MRKAGTVATKSTAELTPVQETTTLIQGAEVFLPFVSYEQAQFIERKGNTEGRMIDAKARINDYMREWTKAYSDLKNMTAPTLSTEDTRGANTIETQLRKHKFIDHVVVLSRDSILVYTKLLFGEIRLREGSRTLKRRCLGAFKIEVNFRGRVTMTNILYPKTIYAHYAVKETRPCFGDYGSNVSQMLQERNIYGIADTLIHFLRFSEDGSAWRQSHEWINARVGYIPQITGGARVRERASIVLMYDWGVFEKGTIHKVVRSREGYPVINDADGVERMIDDRGAYIVIKNNVYKHVSSLRDIERKYLEPIDALPDGATLAEALELLPK
jgi:hypothetical protein